MKKESERPTIVRFKNQELIPSTELHNGSEDFYWKTILPLVLKEKVTRQKSLGLPQYPPDIYYRLVNPVVDVRDIDVPNSLESDHLCRPVTLHRGISQKIVGDFDESLEDMHISKVREMLDILTMHVSKHPIDYGKNQR